MFQVRTPRGSVLFTSPEIAEVSAFLRSFTVDPLGYELHLITRGEDLWPFPADVLDAMRGWIADCSWRDLEPEDAFELTPDEVMRAVKRHYEGGVSQFIWDFRAGEVTE